MTSANKVEKPAMACVLSCILVSLLTDEPKRSN